MKWFEDNKEALTYSEENEQQGKSNGKETEEI